MAILRRDLRFYGSAVMPDDDATTGVGGAIDVTKQVLFSNPDGAAQVVSDDAGDTGNVTIHYRDAADLLKFETVALNGLTPVALVDTTLGYLLKAIKAASAAGNVAVERVNATYTAFATATFDADGALLDTDANPATNAYLNYVFRIVSGTGAGQIRRVIYNVARRVDINNPWDTIPDATSDIRLSRGVVFEKIPSEVMEVRQILYEIESALTGGGSRFFHEKIFIKNCHATDSLTAGDVAEVVDEAGVLGFLLSPTHNDSATTPGGTRLSAPSGTFNSSLKSMENGAVLVAGTAQGVWIQAILAEGLASTVAAYALRGGGTP